MSSRRVQVVSACAALLLVAVASYGDEAYSVRVKDIASVHGVRENQLAGLGLMAGLDGKGDGATSTLVRNVLANVAAAFDVTVRPEDLRSKNCAVVLVTADLHAFARPGDRILVNVASVGDARSLEGGVLLQTNLRAANGQVYAVAQGLVTVAASAGGVKTVGSIPGGGIVEREVVQSFAGRDSLSVVLRAPDFTNASRIAAAIRAAIPDTDAAAVDASLIQMSVPAEYAARPAELVARIERIEVVPDTEARVVVDPRSGVVVIGRNVRIGEVVVSYRDTTVEVGAPSRSRSIDASKQIFATGGPAEVGDVVDLLKSLGLNADTIIGILRAIDRAGALYGRLVVM